MDIKVVMDAARRDYIASARIDEADFLKAFDKRSFYAEIYRQIACKIADKVIERIGPAVDEALEKLKLEEGAPEET